MAKQDGIAPIRGSIDKFQFIKRKDGYGVQKKSPLDATAIATAKNFQLTRENGLEFGRAGRGGKLIRQALAKALLQTSERTLTSRLTKELVKVVKSDPVNDRGNRNVTNGDISLLEGFQFNGNSVLDAVLKCPFSNSFDRATGSVKVTIPGFIPNEEISPLKGASHYKLIVAASEIDFDKGVFVSDIKMTDGLPLNKVNTGDIELTNTVAANNPNPIFIALGILFFQQVNGKLSPMQDRSFNALSLIKTSKA